MASFSDHFSPKIVRELNGQDVELVKFQGEFVWRHHDAEDELFLVVRGSSRMGYRDDAGQEREITVREGEFLIVPRGTEHRLAADEEVEILQFEPAGTLNTGNVRGAMTVEQSERI